MLLQDVSPQEKEQPVSDWKRYPQNKPSKEGYYIVYIDQSAANIPDTMQVRGWDGKCWDDVNQSYCPVTHFKKRPNPPAGTWMAQKGNR
jgi:hypothetical protein